MHTVAHVPDILAFLAEQGVFAGTHHFKLFEVIEDIILQRLLIHLSQREDLRHKTVEIVGTRRTGIHVNQIRQEEHS